VGEVAHLLFFFGSSYVLKWMRKTSGSTRKAAPLAASS